MNTMKRLLLVSLVFACLTVTGWGQYVYRTGTVAIADGASLSDARDLGDRVLVGLIIPSTWTTDTTGTTITFQASANGTDYYNLYDSTGAEVSFTVLATGNQFIKFSPSTWAGVRYIKVRSGTAASADPQAGGDVITLISRSM